MICAEAEQKNPASFFLFLVVFQCFLNNCGLDLQQIYIINL